MAQELAAPASELERRKQVRIRLREDLDIAPQKYEGRTYWVVKDPVSLRYYRFKEQEYFLLGYMDGGYTLDEAQKEFEKRFRPDRLTLEDLEGFAQQLLTAGLAQNESPQAGKQLFDRRKKRKRSEFMQAITNILYIKIPIFDPDKLLRKMLVYTRWIFTLWFGILSVAFMLAAVFLILTHFEAFRERLPDYRAFFSFKNVIYMWIALGVVKVIHEFGHGLSCRAFGGEVHEMGALFLCFSPCLYCNVSDAWTLPSKWQRIIISAAGIYVELIIAAVSVFIWWNTPGQPFINNLSLCLIVVCSISTVIFNANPLMRYDGYYVLADWLEVPNLRDRSNRFLKNTLLEFCLGVEVQPEPYMTTWRKAAFIAFAIISYIYRWVVTFSILYFMYNWLKPYKLGVISQMMAVFAAGSMVGWPLWRLGQNIYKRGRTPDMKPVRVALSSAAIAALLLVVFLVPLPISRVRQLGAVEIDPNSYEVVPVVTSGWLDHVSVENGQWVDKNAELARFSNPELAGQIIMLEGDVRQLGMSLNGLRARKNAAAAQLTSEEIARLDLDIIETQGKLKKAQDGLRFLKGRADELVRRAPREGIVMRAPYSDELHRFWQAGNPEANKEGWNMVAQQAMNQNASPQANVGMQEGNEPEFCRIGDPTKLQVLVPLTGDEFELLKRDLNEARKDGGDLQVDIRVQGLGGQIFQGRIKSLPSQAVNENDRIPEQLTDRHGGPIPVKPKMSHKDSATPGPANQPSILPITPQYIIPIEIENPSRAICPGTMAQVKIHCRWRTTAWWIYHKISDLFDLGLM